MALFTGSGVAITTPFNFDKSINFNALEKHIEFLIDNKTDAIIVCGTTGEAATLNDEEHIETIKFVVDVVKKRIPVIGGAGSNDTEHGINLCKKAQKVGVDGLLIVTPYYNKATQKGIVKYYENISKSVDLPIIAYNVPSRTGLNILPKTMSEIANIENIIGIKEASGNISQIAEMASLCAHKTYIYSGNDDQILPVMALGGVGVISVLANIMPREIHDMCQKFFDGDLAGSREIQLKNLELINSLFVEVNPIPVKEALNLMGFNVGGFRSPLTNMEEGNKQILISAMKKSGLI